MDVKDLQVVVVGLARSGMSAAALLRRHGAEVTATDIKRAEDLGDAVSELAALGVRVEAGGHSAETLARAQLIVLSPGVSLETPGLEEARRRGVPVLSEMELGYRFCRARVAAVTGTNGKTTTVSLLAKMVADAGVPGVLAGNVGLAFSGVAESLPPEGIAVLEVSSFQLETTDEFHPEGAAVLNITPDHLDRYAGIQNYVEAKARIMLRQTKSDFVVLNALDRYRPLLAAQAPGRVVLFSSAGPVSGEGVWAEDGEMRFRLQNAGEGVLLPVRELLIPGAHNLENALAAAALGLGLGLPAERLAHSLRTFPGVPHRLEPVGCIGQVKFVNDSKGTNVDAVSKALQSFPAPLVLILGGRDKHGDFTALNDLLRAHVRAVVLMGEAAGVIAPQIQNTVPIHREETLDRAVRTAHGLARPGDVVLLSPGCASFDQFKNFEERGERFRQEVGRLAAELGQEVQCR
jgi:UDP-N-acetylmuramoylalanine--D-glutamate ligase